MYLIHVQLHSSSGTPLPERAAEFLATCANESDGLEHATAHPDSPAGPVLGLFVSASGLDRAEAAALALCRRAVESFPQLNAFSVVACDTPLVPEHWDAMAAGDEAGRLMPLHDPSTRNPFHPF